MRQTAFVLVLCVLGVALGAPADATVRRPCVLSGSKVILASTHARVYERARSSARYQYYACWQKDRRRMNLGTAHGKSGPYGMTLGGAYIAYVQTNGGETSATLVKNLRNGRTVRRVSWSSQVLIPLKGIAVTGTGAVAFLYEPTTGSYELRKDDADGEATLDAGSTIDPSSLALGGKVVYWTSANVARSATLR